MTHRGESGVVLSGHTWYLNVVNAKTPQIEVRGLALDRTAATGFDRESSLAVARRL